MSTKLVEAAKTYGWESITRSSRYRLHFRRGTEVVRVEFSTAGKVVEATRSDTDGRQEWLKQADKNKLAIVLGWLAQPSALKCGRCDSDDDTVRVHTDCTVCGPTPLCAGCHAAHSADRNQV